MSPHAPRSKRAAAATASRATTQQFNLPDVDELFAPAPAPLAKRRRVQKDVVEVEIEVDTAPARPKRAAAAAASRSITDQYSLTRVNKLSARAPANRYRQDDESTTAPSPTTPPPAEQTFGRINALLAPQTPPSPPQTQTAPRRSSRPTKPLKWMLDENEEELSAHAEDVGDGIELVSDDEGSEKSEEYSGEEDSDEDDAPGHIYLDEYSRTTRSSNSDDEDEIEIPAPDDTAPSETVVGEDGLIYMTSPPKEDAPFILAGPATHIGFWISAAIHNVRRRVDAQLPGADRTTFPARRLELTSHLEKSLIQHGEDRFGLICDYTGMDMSWARGSRARSIEAFYPFVLMDGGQLGYHEAINIGFITAHLNWTKRDSPPTVLPLLAHMLRAVQEPDFQTHQRTMTWGYIALRNVCIGGNVLKCHGATHTSKAAAWAQWDKPKLIQVLEELRTAKRGPVTQEELAKWTPRQLLGHHDVGWLGGPVATRFPEDFSSWGVVYEWLQRVAKSYGLIYDEFKYYCTAASPSDSTQRVFYPFHILSRPEAEELEWDWHTLYAKAHKMLLNMRSNCNKYAEKAGYGESKLDELRLIVWWCHVLCRKIQMVKAERPTATREEIAFGIVDRWGLPVIPWVHSPLRASLCRKQDHHIAMVSGLVWPDGEEFDPVKHFDMDRSTITIDTRGTNIAMRDFAVSSWAGIREMLMAVPLSHPLWQIDPAVGLAGWVGTWHSKLPTPQPPVFPFNIPLQPINPWVDSNLALQPLRCAECPGMADFQTIGLLVRHYRTQHGGKDRDTFPASSGAPSAEPVEVEEEFWKPKCPYCGKQYNSPKNLQRHLARHCGRPESGTKPRFVCSICDEIFWNREGRANHRATVHGEKAYRCDVDGCDAVYNSPSSLDKHRRYMHNKGLLVCRVKGCPQMFGSTDEVLDHLLKQHSDIALPCPVEGCGHVFLAKRALAIHKRTVHGQGWSCKHCAEEFKSPKALKHHIIAVHPPRRLYECTAENCNEVYTNDGARRAHERTVHNLGLLKCRKGCSESFTHHPKRVAHEREQHPDTQE